MKKKICCIMTIIVLITSLAGCGPKTDPSDKTTPDGSPTVGSEDISDNQKGVNIYVEGIMNTLDPYATIDYTSWYTWNQVYETLVRIDEIGNPVKCLAKDYSISDDGLVYTFNIEEGVKFHNGEELKASDVAYSINTAKTKPVMSSWTNMIDKAVVTGDYTVEIHLLRQYAAFFSMLAQLPIVNEKFYSAQDSNYDVGIGTGPYMYLEGSVDPNTEVTCVRYDDYRLGPAQIPSITFKVITDASTATLQFETGELDFMMVYSVSNYAPLADSGKYNYALVSAPHTAYITINNEIEPLNNKALRQALSYATDKETITLVSYEGLAVPAKMLTGPNSFGADFSGAIDFNFDLEKAKAKLVEAGFPNGINFDDFGIELDYIPGSYHEKIAQCIQQTWDQAGIKVKLRASETYTPDCASGNYTLCTQGSAYYTDTALAARLYTTSSINATNYSRYSNPRIDELFRQGDAVTDETERKAIYKEICETVIEDCPVIPTQHKQIPYVWNKDLNAKVYPSNDHNYYVYEWSWN